MYIFYSDSNEIPSMMQFIKSLGKYYFHFISSTVRVEIVNILHPEAKLNNKQVEMKNVIEDVPSADTGEANIIANFTFD